MPEYKRGAVLKKRKKENEWHHKAGDRATFLLSVFLDLRGRWGGGWRDEAVRHTLDCLHFAA